MVEVRVDIDALPSKGSAHFAPPTIVGEFTVNEAREIKLGREKARHLYHDVIGKRGFAFDLNLGQETFKAKPTNKNADTFFEWIRQTSGEDKDLKQACQDADIVAYRGTLTRISTTPYKKGAGDGWKIAATRPNGQSLLFLNELPTEEKIRREAAETEKEKKMTYWGFKFEQYVTVSKTWMRPNTKEPVSQLNEYDIVVKSQIARNGRKYKLLYAAETDAIDRDGHPVEIKTQRESLDFKFWRNKSLSWFMQSYLVGIKDIVVGFRNDDGIVASVESVQVEKLAFQNANGTMWEKDVCFNFLAEILEKLDDFVDDSRVSCIVEYFPMEGAVVFQDAENGEDQFLSENFKGHFAIE